MTLRFQRMLSTCLLLVGCGDDSGWASARLTDEAPWVVQLTFPGVRGCTAMVLSEHWLLTAGHCAVGLPSDEVEVSHNLFDVRHVVYRGRATLHVHPDYTGPTSLQHRWNDVALVGLLEGSIDADERARLAGLPDQPGDMDGWPDPFFSIGYGYLPDPSTGECSDEIGPKKRYDGFELVDIFGPFLGELLTVDLEGRRHALCSGDSGAPIMYAIDGEPHVWAVFSGASLMRTTFFGTLTAAKVAWFETATEESIAPLRCLVFGDRVWECYE